MIYEEVLRQEPRCFQLFIGGGGPAWAERGAALSLTITRVNHQLRQESIPIIYQHLQVRVVTQDKACRSQAHRWAQEVNATILAAARSFTFKPLDCVRNVKFAMANLDDPLEKERVGSCDLCDNIDTYAQLGREKVLQLEVCD